MDLCLITHPYCLKQDTGRGIDRVNHELYKNLGRQGIRTNVIDSGEMWSFPEIVFKESIFPLKLRGVKADIFHATQEIGAKSAIMAGRKPLVTTVHDTLPLENSWNRRFRYRMEFKYRSLCLSTVAKKSDFIITPQQYTKDFLLSRFDILPERIRVVSYGLDHERFFVRKKDEKETKRILFIGKLIDNKGIDTLVKAFKIVKKNIGSVELLIGSGGPQRERSEDLVRTLGISNSVKFLGHIPEDRLQHYYSSADIFVFPSRHGFGMPLLEAMACGTPVIGSNRYDSPDFLEGTGVMVDPDSPVQLSEAIMELLRDEGLRKEYSKKGIKKAREYSWEKMARETVRVYEELI